MLYLRAAVALAAAMTFSLTALGETRTTIAVFTAPSGPRAPALVLGATSDSFSTTIPRYTPPPTLILGIAEITIPDCTDKDPGMWTNPNPSLKPVFKGIPAGTVGFQRTFMAKAQNGPCAGKGPFTFRAIDFSWMAHYNQTGLGPGVAPPPCKTTNPVCPTAVFQGEWTTKDKMFDIVFSFQVSVDVVRPIGETTKFQGWSGLFGSGLVGMWEATLKPPTSDKNFDFTGETTRERFSNKRDSCAVKTTNNIPLGNIKSHGKEFPVIEGPPGKYVDGVSTGGDDPQSACSVLCNFVTHPAGCLLTVQQQMSIKSPADMDFVEYPAVNILEATSLGSITNDLLRGTRGKATVTSNRFPISEPPPTPQSHESDLSISNCTSIKIPTGPNTSRPFKFPQDCSK
jgi:hypothetical protein